MDHSSELENLSNIQQILQASSDSVADWWELALSSVPKEKRREFNGLAIYIMWNLWKERNCRIFDNIYSTATQVAGRVKDDIVQYKRAFTTTQH